MTVKYLEDFAAGQTFGSGRIVVERALIKRFAAEFDPQPFHLDDEAAQNLFFRGLAASGWHTAAMIREQIAVVVRVAPSFEAFGRLLEASNRFSSVAE